MNRAERGSSSYTSVSEWLIVILLYCSSSDIAPRAIASGAASITLDMNIAAVNLSCTALH